jgi:hypothetical protein
MSRIRTITSAADVVDAAMSVAQDAADGKLSPADLEAAAIGELRSLVGEVVGPGDRCWELQCEIARSVLAAGGIPADEVSEWAAVQRASEEPPLSVPEPSDPHQVAPEPISFASGPLSPENDQPDADPECVAEIEAEQPAAPVIGVPPHRRSDGYDPLRGFVPGKTKRGR